MPAIQLDPRQPPGPTYAVLRQGGASPSSAARLLGAGPPAAAKLEAGFRTRTAKGAAAALRPRFARHDSHVQTVLAAGGFPVMPKRGRR